MPCASFRRMANTHMPRVQNPDHPGGISGQLRPSPFCPQRVFLDLLLPVQHKQEATPSSPSSCARSGEMCARRVSRRGGGGGKKDRRTVLVRSVDRFLFQEHVSACKSARTGGMAHVMDTVVTRGRRSRRVFQSAGSSTAGRTCKVDIVDSLNSTRSTPIPFSGHHVDMQSPLVVFIDHRR